MLTLSWSDHFLRGSFDENMQQLYLGDGGVADVFVQALADLAWGWKQRLEWNENEGELDRFPISSAKEARSQANARKGHFGMASGDTKLEMFLAGAQTLSVDLAFASTDKPAARTLEVARRVHAAAPQELVLSPVLALRTRPIPRIRPRRVLAFWPTDALVLVVDRSRLARCIDDQIAGGKTTQPGEPRYQPAFLNELDQLQAAPLPAGATRTEVGGLWCLDFTGAGAEAGAAAAAFEEWITNQPLEMARHANDNQAGDPMVDWSHLAARAPEKSGVTLYDRFGCTAYCADVQVGRSISRPEKLRLLQRVKADGKLSTGERVKKAMLIVAVREEALALCHLVDEKKVDAVVYLDECMRDPNILGESRYVPWKESAKKKPAKKKPAKKK